MTSETPKSSKFSISNFWHNESARSAVFSRYFYFAFKQANRMEYASSIYPRLHDARPFNNIIKYVSLCVTNLMLNSDGNTRGKKSNLNNSRCVGATNIYTSQPDTVRYPWFQMRANHIYDVHVHVYPFTCQYT